MLILALIGSVWIFSCVMAVALCVAARRGDERITVALFPAADVDVDVAFVATFAEPEAQAPVARPSVPQHSAL
jgi:hypothetical protein